MQPIASYVVVLQIDIIKSLFMDLLKCVEGLPVVH